MRTLTTIKLWSILCLVSTYFISSCGWMTSADKRLARDREDIRKLYQKQIYKQQRGINQGSVKLTWGQALEKMYLHNPELIQADFRIADAKRQQKEVWVRMIPGLTVNVSDSFTVRDAGDAFSNTRFRVNSFLSLGNLLDLPKQVYTNRLRYIGSELQAENAMRQQVIALYRIFKEQELLNLQKKMLDYETRILASLSDDLSHEVLEQRVKHKDALRAWNENYKEWLEKLGDFFMAGYSEADLKTASCPDISYKLSELDFSDTNRWGLLQMNLLALEQIADEGRVLEAYLRYIPRADLSVSSPPLFSNSQGQKFDPSLIRLFPSLNWNLDSQGYISQQLRRLKRESPIKKWRRDKRAREEIAKLLDGKKALAEIRVELSEVRKAQKLYKDAVKSGLVKNPEKAIQTMRKLVEKETTLKAKEIEIFTAFWLIDEHRWKSLTKRWLETRKDREAIRKKSIKGQGFFGQLKKWYKR